MDHGIELVRSVARWLVVYPQGERGGQSQFSVLVETALPPQSPLRKVSDAISAAPAADHSVTTLAMRASLSTAAADSTFSVGNLARQTRPRYVEMVRHRCRPLPRSTLGRSVADSARVAGFGKPPKGLRARIRRPPRRLAEGPIARDFRTASRG